MTDLTSDVDAERALIGACLIDPSAIDASVSLVDASDFVSPRHQAIWDAIVGVWALGDRVDPIDLHKRIQGAEVDLAYLHELLADNYSVGYAARYATSIAEARVRRRLVQAGAEIVSLGQGRSASNDAADAADRARALLADIDMPGEVGAPSLNLDDWLATVDLEYDWLFPHFLERRDRMLVTAGEGAGKELRTDEPILTTAGWSTMGDLRVGDRVFDMHGHPCNVVHKSEVDHTPDAYAVHFSDGSVIEADARHQWVTVDYRARQRDHAVDVVTTAEIRDTLHARGGFTLNHAVPVAGPLDVPDVPLPLDPYLLGVWLGDGTTLEGLVTLNREDADHIEARIQAAGWTTGRVPSAERPGCVGVRVYGLRRLLSDLGLRGHKHIPTAYFRGSEAQRRALLEGMMDTDGYCGDGRGSGRGRGASKLELTFMAGQLPVDAVALIRTLGVIATATESDAVLEGRVVGRRVRIQFQSPVNPFTVPRKADRWFPLRTRRSTYRYITAVDPCPPSPMQCIQVDSPTRTYLAGPNLIPTHNSLLLAQIGIQGACGVHPWTHAEIDPIRVLLVDCENGDKKAGRTLTKLRDRAHKAAADRYNPDNFVPELRPAGLDITSPVDRRWLTDRIRANQPDLVIIGPAYKLTKGAAAKGDIGGEAAAKEVVDVLDDVRTRFGCALLMETHAPKGSSSHPRDLAPFGSSVWMRWPEFGIGLAQNGDDPRGNTWDLGHWRGPRDVRTWPKQLVRGGRWPWTATGMPDGTYRTNTSHEPPPPPPPDQEF